MSVELYLLVLVFAVALTAFAVAINANGVVRNVLCYIFASAILIGGVVLTVNYISDMAVRKAQEIAAKEAEKLRYEEQLRKAEEEARLAAEQQSSTGDEKQYKASLMDIVTKGSDIARSILSVNVDDENADYDALVSRSAGLKNQSYALQKQLDNIKEEDGATDLNETRKILEKAVKTLAVGANYFNLYFKAEDEDQEDERFDIYQRNCKAARSDFSRASEKLK
ncbi:MAG: hypothetical protein A2487_16930 [Candidatus Raymondbacteria bacterium RifOxyC12_full_50_8]|uniref:Uncharacterized protein n=1 Tax=Candidatus Raymondbacteria bacterium RIFOXYD12_FULL_49_13 TaxID=1817890 RepID=A0A1F7F0I5_UNCRA|nr:MAG: hypothetical protein A2248_21805 [Candidatus Raymondbacteria bacterium RIFOXYA2_FULL_49_16]OGK00073.1 MAG: hypothetical protein A2519_22360 [Candidatus Raymondbacteria bacterium RIFOXYD12_FULL_49_13]OGK01362.1 MAG: hypothetical protein A2487_16930 [Candidatus Raymondbacteria bacterium RifOxyC12_full_50_8]OGK03690.1 MAG: hypothetical protein A2350_13040 [Candidatus Raymondbacteria bacterium RifOxyB12_full_50_8]OGP45062.1 MAG: hypothetical protein A2324_13685 [Candidatus Raymondbacteria b